MHPRAQERQRLVEGTADRQLPLDRLQARLREHLQRSGWRSDEHGFDPVTRQLFEHGLQRHEPGHVDVIDLVHSEDHDLHVITDRANRSHCALGSTEEQRLLMMSSFLIDYPFAERLYPRALEVIRHLSRFGPTAILTDGDVVFQPRKLQRSGLWDAVDGRALIYVHKEKMLDAVERHYPSRHYVMVDDKLRILAAMKAVWQERLTTIFPRQGHYAHDPAVTGAYPAADFTIERIGELADLDLSPLIERTIDTTRSTPGIP